MAHALQISFLLNDSEPEVPVVPKHEQQEVGTDDAADGSAKEPVEIIQVVGRKKHMRFSCPSCGKFFRMQRDLRHHVRCVHEKQRPHKCSICSACFSVKPNLSRHVRTVHEGKRPFQCNTCKRAFGLKENLDKHVRLVHEKQRPFSCEHCGFSFGIMSTLKRHIRKFHAPALEGADTPTSSPASTVVKGLQSPPLHDSP